MPLSLRELPARVNPRPWATWALSALGATTGVVAFALAPQAVCPLPA